MARHKHIAFYAGDQELFGYLRQKGYVAEQYDYTNPQAKIGNVYLAKESGEEFISIASDKAKKVTYDTSLQRRRCATYRRMYRLTEEGWAFLKGLLVEESI